MYIDEFKKALFKIMSCFSILKANIATCASRDPHADVKSHM